MRISYWSSDVCSSDLVSGLKRRLDQALVAGGRPVLGEAKADNARPEVKAFVDRYLRKGLEQGVELKAFQGTTPGDGGYAVPREIDSVIDRKSTRLNSSH